ncbi:CASP-like protein 1F2 [Carica papaya]|uniref:CASP-like protein 1F2 n=1 Tax=Carica papaya TaxID=3649 RepID=UPI000B8C7DE1|nr:CASP-like protein 1F2 [Carica papaya]
MANAEPKILQNPPTKTHKFLLLLQIFLRASVMAASLASTSLIVTNKETTLVFGIPVQAKYSYSPSFKFLAIANAFAASFTLLSLVFTLIASRRGITPGNYFFFFLHDLAMMSLVLAGCAAATAVGYLGKNGDSHAGWLPICNYLDKFCKRMTTATVTSYLSLILLLSLTIISATRSREIQV